MIYGKSAVWRLSSGLILFYLQINMTGFLMVSLIAMSMSSVVTTTGVINLERLLDTNSDQESGDS